MQEMSPNADDGVEKRLRAEALLQAYPALSEEEVQQLLHWFRREASALDIGMLAQNESIREGYTQFRADHVDGFKIRDLGNGLLLTIAIVGTIAGIAYLAM